MMPKSKIKACSCGGRIARRPAGQGRRKTPTARFTRELRSRGRTDTALDTLLKEFIVEERPPFDPRSIPGIQAFNRLFEPMRGRYFNGRFTRDHAIEVKVRIEHFESAEQIVNEMGLPTDFTALIQRQIDIERKPLNKAIQDQA